MWAFGTTGTSPNKGIFDFDFTYEVVASSL